MEYTKKEFYTALAEIGTTNTSEEKMVNILTDQESGIRVTDNDRHYFWILEPTKNEQFKITYQSSIF